MEPDGFCRPDWNLNPPSPSLVPGAGIHHYDFAGQTGNGGFSGDGGPAAGAKLDGPYSIALDSSGNLYIADTSNDVVRKIALNGIITTVAGSDSQGYSGDGGPATLAQLKGPEAVAIDTSGNLYIADTGNDVIRKMSANGIITTVAGGGSGCAQQTDSAGDGCPATSAELDVPSGVAVDAASNLYIADTNHNRVRRVSANGVITSAAGTGNFGYSGDGGLATNAKLDGPLGIALDSAGSLYITDTTNYVIRKISTNGTIATVAGSNSQGYSGDGGAAVDAKLNTPEGVTVDSSGNIYIADTLNSRVREVLVNGTIITIAGNGSCGTSSYVQSGSLPTLPTIQIGGISAVVQFAGLVSPGLYQFNVVVPASAPSGDNAITATYNGSSTQAGTMLTVEP